MSSRGLKRQRGEIIWYQQAAMFKSITKMPWSDLLSYLAYPTQAKWAAAVRGDTNFDLVTFCTPILFGVILVVALIVGKYAQHPDLAWLIGGSGFVSTLLACGLLAWFYGIPLDQCAGGLVGAAIAMGYGIWRSAGAVKTSDGEILVAAVVVVAMGVRASAGDPLTVRVISYMINLLLLGAATVQLDSGRRMGSAAILVHGVVSLLDYPYGYMADEIRSVHFTFTSSAAAALNTEFFGSRRPSYIPYLSGEDGRRGKGGNGVSVSIELFPGGPEKADGWFARHVPLHWSRIVHISGCHKERIHRFINFS